MTTPTATDTTPYDKDERFADLEDLVAALEQQWAEKRKSASLEA